MNAHTHRVTTVLTAAAVSATVLFGATLMADDEPSTPRTVTASSVSQLIEECEYEDGSTQEVCYWNGGRNGNGHTLVNLNYGQFTYDMVTHELKEY